MQRQRSTLQRTGQGVASVTVNLDPANGHDRLARDLDPLVLVSGTNGKTTTTALLSAALRAGGRQVVTNTTGSNLRSGLVSALLCHRGPADCAVLEVDEATLPRVIGDLRPSVLVLLNLSRDQLG